MAIVTPSDDILVQGDPSSLYSFTASSAVSGGAVVKASGDMKVIMTTGEDIGIVGVSLYEVAAGETVSVAGPHSIVRCCASGTDIREGDDVYGSNTGRIDKQGTYSNANRELVGIALESQTTNNGAIRVLLK